MQSARMAEFEAFLTGFAGRQRVGAAFRCLRMNNTGALVI
jgi:hypothetical protein